MRRLLITDLPRSTKRLLAFSTMIVVSSMLVGCIAAQENAGGAITSSESVADSTVKQAGAYNSSTFDSIQPTSSSSPLSSGSRPTIFVTGTQTVSGVGAVISPPPLDANPVVSQKAASDAFATNPVVNKLVGPMKTPKSVRLATYENKFGETHPDAPDTPSVPAQLAWVAEFVFPDTGPVSGPADGPTALPPPGPVCTLTVAISALTAASLDSFDICAVPTS